MPIKMDQFKDLPKVTPSTRKGGKKVDWTGVRNEMAGKGGYPISEVHALTLNHALIEIVDDKGKVVAKPKPADLITRFRVSRWLKKQSDDGKMDVRQGEGGYVYAVIGLPPKA